MRSALKFLGLAIIVACVALGVTGHLPLHLIAPTAGGIMMAGPLILATPKSADALKQQSTASGELEAIPWCFYDTQTYVDNTTVSLDFFATVTADKTLSNMEAAAAIPAPNYFEITHFTCDFLFAGPSNANAAVTGVLDDLANLLNAARARLVFTMNQKPYVSVPLRAIGSSGGAVGLLQGTTAANQVEEWATNSVPGTNPYHIAKAVTIAPNNNFGATVSVAAAANLSGNVNICIGMWGVYHRKVV